MTFERTTINSTRTPVSKAGRNGFTLLELTAVVAIITILVSLLCAALNQTKARALRLSCLDNMRQLQFAWLTYTADNGEALPLNQTAPAPNHPRTPAYLARASSTNSWVTGNPLYDRTTKNIRAGTLYPYVLSDSVYRCPMDESTVRNHPDTPRTRSYSISAFLGGDPDLRPLPKVMATELIRPQDVFVFIEEHESSLWQSSFLVVPGRQSGKLAAASAMSWLSTPSDRHNQGCNISFADGHIEYWRWYSPKSPSDGTHLSSTPLDLSDMRRLSACVPTE